MLSLVRFLELSPSLANCQRNNDRKFPLKTRKTTCAVHDAKHVRTRREATVDSPKAINRS